MAIRLYKAYSPGTRTKSVSYFDDLIFRNFMLKAFFKTFFCRKKIKAIVYDENQWISLQNLFIPIKFQRKS